MKSISNDFEWAQRDIPDVLRENKTPLTLPKLARLVGVSDKTCEQALQKLLIEETVLAFPLNNNSTGGRFFVYVLAERYEYRKSNGKMKWVYKGDQA